MTVRTFDELYELLFADGPDALVGAHIRLDGVTHEVIAVSGAGDDMIAFELRNLQTMAEDIVLKVPRARPGTDEHAKLMESVEASNRSIGRFAGRFAATKSLTIDAPEPVRPADAAVAKLIMEALRAIGRGDLPRAHAAIDDALRLHPESVDALNNKGCMLSMEGRLDEAMVLFNKVLELKPGDLDACTNRGNVYFRKSDFAKALEAFRSVVAADENYIHGWLGLGTVLGTMREFADAELCFLRARAIDPTNGMANAGLAQIEQLLRPGRS